jgi:hypothetical protein
VLTATIPYQAGVGYHSTNFDKFLLFLLVFSIYFESNLPSFFGASTPFIIFGFTMVYISFTRLNTLMRLFSSRYFITAMAFALLCIFMETIHQYSEYDFVFRYINMTLGMFGIAALCRDRQAFDLAMFTFVLASAAQSVLIITGTAPLLSSITARGFTDASHARIVAFEEFYLRGSLTDISYFSSIGAIIGIIWSYYEKIRWRRILLIILAMCSVLGVFLTASRTGAVIFFASVLIFIIKSHVNVKKWILPLIVLLLFVAISVPEVVWVRLGSLVRLTELQSEDSRSKVYLAVLRNIDQYVLTGVGSGNYWNGWAVKSGITNRYTTDVAMAAHNAFFQVWIYWGLPALLGFIYLMRVYFKALDTNIIGDRRKACIYIFMMIIPMIFIFYHSFYHKSFSIGIGLLLSARFWNIFEGNSVSHK